jgi:hypothetical protein
MNSKCEGERSTSHPCHFTDRERDIQFLLKRRLGWPQSQSGCFGGKKSLLALQRIEP